MRYLYTLLFYLALPFIFLRLFWRGRLIPNNRKHWAERLGFCPFKVDQCIWVHAISVGESIAAIPLIKALQTEFPHLSIVVTNTTVTGAARIQAALGDTVLHTYLPYDVPDAVARFLNRIHPSIAIILETELWPNLFAACQKRNIPIVIANACLSEKSSSGYQKIKSLTRDMLAAVRCIAAQGPVDAKRFMELGLAKDKITITGSLKFDLELSTELANQTIVLRQILGTGRLIWIAASTHPTEEEIILEAHKNILKQHPNALLILVPRHPDRFDSVAAFCEQRGFHMARRGHCEAVSAGINIYLGDTMGELLLLYSVADVVFVGGSFGQIGGHNLLEPAVLQKPILTGPQLFNVVEVRDMLLNAKGLCLVNNADELAAQIQRLFNDKSFRQTMGSNAYQVVQANRGAVAKHIALIKNVLHFV